MQDTTPCRACGKIAGYITGPVRAQKGPALIPGEEAKKAFPRLIIPTTGSACKGCGHMEFFADLSAVSHTVFGQTTKK
jgi:hypothetical protein